MANTHAHIALWAETVANTCPVCTLPSNIACLDISEHQMLLFTEETPADLYFFTLFFSSFSCPPPSKKTWGGLAMDREVDGSVPLFPQDY